MPDSPEELAGEIFKKVSEEGEPTLLVLKTLFLFRRSQMQENFTEFFTRIASGEDVWNEARFHQKIAEKFSLSDFADLVEAVLREQEKDKIDAYTNLYTAFVDNEVRDASVRRQLIRCARELTGTEITLCKDIYEEWQQKSEAAMEQWDGQIRSDIQTNPPWEAGAEPYLSDKARRVWHSGSSAFPWPSGRNLSEFKESLKSVTKEDRLGEVKILNLQRLGLLRVDYQGPGNELRFITRRLLCLFVPVVFELDDSEEHIFWLESDAGVISWFRR